MPSNNTTIRYSKMSAAESTVNGDDIILVGQPDPTNLKTGYSANKTTVKALSDHFKTILKEEGLKGLITLGDGLIGDGSPGSIEVDESYVDGLAIRHDHLNLSYVGDRTFPVLPLSGSYFSINYPYDSEEEAATAYIETSGDILILAPVTNGIEKRYTYTTIKNWVGGGRTPEPSDTVYQPPGLAPDEYVSAIFPASQTAMLIEITNSTNLTRTHAVVLLNGTLSYQYHTLSRITNLPQWLWGNGYTYRAVQDRPPAVYLRNGRIIIVGASGGSSQSGISLKWGELDPWNGTITTFNNVRITGRMYTETNNAGTMRVTGGFMTTDTTSAGKVFEVTANTMFSSSSASSTVNTGGAHKQLSLAILQNKNGVRLAFKRNDTWYHPENGNAVPYIYAFTTFFDIIEDPATQGADIHAKELSDSITQRHTVVASLTEVTWGGGYRGDRIGYYSLALSPQATYLADGTLFLSSPSSASTVNAGNLIYRGRKGTDGYNYAEYSRNTDPTLPGTDWSGTALRTMLSSLTPVVARGAIFYLPTSVAEQNNGNSGTVVTMSGGFAAESKIPAYARVKGDWKAETFKLMDLGDVKGYKLNNDRGTLPDIQRRPILSFQDKNKVIRHTHTCFTSLDADDPVQNYEITHDYQVLKTVKFPKAVKDKFVTDITNLFNTGTFLTTYRFTLLPNDPLGRAIYVITVANKTDGASYKAYGVMKVTTTAAGNALTITAIDLLGSKFFKFNQTAWFYYFSAGSLLNCGWACVENADGSLDFGVKEGITLGGINGNQSGTAGCYRFNQASVNADVTYVTGYNSPDGTSSVLFPAVGPQNIGLSLIDATAGLGTNYTIRPMIATGDAEVDKGILIASPTPSKTFTVNIGGDIPVQLNGAVGVVPSQSLDLATLAGGNAASKKFYFYAVEKNKEVTLEVLTTPVNESLARTLFAVVATNAEVIESIKAIPFSRLGLYRLSETPIGSAVAFNQGSFAEYVDRFWLTRWYGDKDINWDDYFIPETTIEGPVYQVLTLAPGAKLELVVYGAGAGGGGSRYTGGNFDPVMNGVGSEASSIYIDDTKYVTLTGASGGTEGWWGNGSHFQNGEAGVGGVASIATLNVSGVVIEEIRTADGNAGKGGWDRDNAGGVKANLTTPASVPVLPTYGAGGKGANGVGDEGLAYGGGGGSGAATYIRIRNDNVGPLLIAFDIPEAGIGGDSAVDGAAGAEGVAWYRQIPKV